jgi:REP element-mobilizing transposase RayT
MPVRDHMHRLRNVWIRNPVYFLTVCSVQRRRIMTRSSVAAILVESWQAAPEVHGWVVGRYVIMPEHVHFFASAQPEAKSLSMFMRDWKKWTTRQVTKSERIKPPVWQLEFFDHVLRSARSYSEKWDYVRENPVRAGLVAAAEDWPYAGECEQLGC